MARAARRDRVHAGSVRVDGRIRRPAIGFASIAIVSSEMTGIDHRCQTRVRSSNDGRRARRAGDRRADPPARPGLLRAAAGRADAVHAGGARAPASRRRAGGGCMRAPPLLRGARPGLPGPRPRRGARRAPAGRPARGAGQSPRRLRPRGPRPRETHRRERDLRRSGGRSGRESPTRSCACWRGSRRRRSSLGSPGRSRRPASRSGARWRPSARGSCVRSRGWPRSSRAGWRRCSPPRSPASGSTTDACSRRARASPSSHSTSSRPGAAGRGGRRPAPSGSASATVAASPHRLRGASDLAASQPAGSENAGRSPAGSGSVRLMAPRSGSRRAAQGRAPRWAPPRGAIP